MNKITVYVPARVQSQRVENKPLVQIGDRPLIAWCLDGVLENPHVCRVVIVTDSQEVVEIAEARGHTGYIEKQKHKNGTEAIAEAVAAMGEKDDEVIVNVQGDHFIFDPNLIDVVHKLVEEDRHVALGSLCTDMDAMEYKDSAVVKVVRDKDENALYYSRTPIPYNRYMVSDVFPKKHLGIYAYTVRALKRYSVLEQQLLEKTEGLEQLRFLEHGYMVKCKYVPNVYGYSIDTQEQLMKCRERCTQRNVVEVDISKEQLEWYRYLRRYKSIEGEQPFGLGKMAKVKYF